MNTMKANSLMYLSREAGIVAGKFETASLRQTIEAAAELLEHAAKLAQVSDGQEPDTALAWERWKLDPRDVLQAAAHLQNDLGMRVIVKPDGVAVCGTKGALKEALESARKRWSVTVQ